MINEIVNKMRDKLGELPFLTKVGGLARTQVKDKLRYPVVRSDGFSDCVGDYIDMLPSRNEIGLCFFESLSNSAMDFNNHKTKNRATLNLVVWVNMKQLNPSNIALVEAHVTKKLLTTNFESLPAYLRNVRVSITDTSYANPYAKYSLDENLRQYMMYPYTAFTMQLGVDYYFIDSCLPTVAVSGITEC